MEQKSLTCLHTESQGRTLYQGGNEREEQSSVSHSDQQRAAHGAQGNPKSESQSHPSWMGTRRAGGRTELHLSVEMPPPLGLNSHPGGNVQVEVLTQRNSLIHRPSEQQLSPRSLPHI